MNDTVGLKILTAKEFEVKIKTIMKDSSLTMIESIVHFCQLNNLEIETAASLISPRMKSEIESEAISSRMIISKKARLPI